MKRQYGVGLIIFLVLLRIAIGWHFFIEGVDKIRSRHRGETLTQKPWTSAHFLRESKGPLAPFFRAQVGDLDQEAMALLTVKQPQGDQLNGKATSKDLISPELDKHWNTWFERFATHYKLEPAQRQKALATLDQAKSVAADWLLGRSPKDTPTYEKEIELDNRTVTLKVPVPDQIKAYRQKLAEIRAIEEQENYVFEKPIRTDVGLIKAEAGQLRYELTTDLSSILTDRLEKELTSEQKKMGNVPPPEPSWKLYWTDILVSYGLTIIGLFLLIGVFTRTSCALGALFLLSVYLAMPPLPWIDMPRAEGKYVFVNKTLIEMLALLALATTPSGKWLGFDGLLSRLNPFRKRNTNQTETNT